MLCVSDRYLTSNLLTGTVPDWLLKNGGYMYISLVFLMLIKLYLYSSYLCFPVWERRKTMEMRKSIKINARNMDANIQFPSFIIYNYIVAGSFHEICCSLSFCCSDCNAFLLQWPFLQQFYIGELWAMSRRKFVRLFLCNFAGALWLPINAVAYSYCWKFYSCFFRNLFGSPPTVNNL